MLDCSELLERVQEYGNKIKSIVAQIQNHVVDSDDDNALERKEGGKYKIKYNHKKGKNTKIYSTEKGYEVQKVQDKLRKSEFCEAMQIVYDNMQIPFNQIRLTKSEYQYLKYL